MYSLEFEEASWKLNSRALWLLEGDQNTKIFHCYANYRKMVNSIKELKGEGRIKLQSFKALSERVAHFSALLKKYERTSVGD